MWRSSIIAEETAETAGETRGTLVGVLGEPLRRLPGRVLFLCSSEQGHSSRGSLKSSSSPSTPPGTPAVSAAVSAAILGNPGFPEGPERGHLDAARQKLPGDNFCRSIATQSPLTTGAFLNRKNVRSEKSQNESSPNSSDY